MINITVKYAVLKTLIIALKYVVFSFQNRHCLLNVSPAAVDALHKVQIYPIVLFIRHKSSKQIRWVTSLVVGLSSVKHFCRKTVSAAGVWLFRGSATFHCFSLEISSLLCFSLEISSLWPCLVLLKNMDFSVFQCFATLANHIPAVWFQIIIWIIFCIS